MWFSMPLIKQNAVVGQLTENTMGEIYHKATSTLNNSIF